MGASQNQQLAWDVEVAQCCIRAHCHGSAEVDQHSVHVIFGCRERAHGSLQNSHSHLPNFLLFTPYECDSANPQKWLSLSHRGYVT